MTFDLFLLNEFGCIGLWAIQSLAPRSPDSVFQNIVYQQQLSKYINGKPVDAYRDLKIENGSLCLYLNNRNSS